MSKPREWVIKGHETEGRYAYMPNFPRLHPSEKVRVREVLPEPAFDPKTVEAGELVALKDGLFLLRRKARRYIGAKKYSWVGDRYFLIDAELHSQTEFVESKEILRRARPEELKDLAKGIWKP